MAIINIDDLHSDSSDSDASTQPSHFRSGYAVILGKPNAGKSTLLNRLLGTHLSIATPKAQTTRHQITGIYHDEDAQIVFYDTPGLITPTYALQRTMMKSVEVAVEQADVALFIFDPLDTFPSDAAIAFLKRWSIPMILLVNKVDLYADRVESLAQRVEERFEGVDFTHQFWVSAKEGEKVDDFLTTLKSMIPLGPPLYPPDQLSEHPTRFFVAELIREQLFLQFEQEIPYSCAVQIIEYKEGDSRDDIYAEIIVNRDSQKGMIIGKKGAAIKRLGIAARASIEALIGKQAFLDLRVKVRDKWRESDTWVRRFGY